MFARIPPFKQIVRIAFRRASILRMKGSDGSRKYNFLPCILCIPGIFIFDQLKNHGLSEGEEGQQIKYPQMTAKEMREMVENADRVVVAYCGGVYDVTNFTGHPGGYGRIQMASGGDLEVYWSVYTQHNRGHIEHILQRYKIGELSPTEAKIIRDTTIFDNPYKNDPSPSKDLLTNTRYPYNAEGRLSQLRDSWITPIGKHFVRNHSTVPDIKENEYKLLVTGAGLNDTYFTLEDLKSKFPKVEVSMYRVGSSVMKTASVPLYYIRI